MERVQEIILEPLTRPQPAGLREPLTTQSRPNSAVAFASATTWRGLLSAEREGGAP
jgi:hypothetical protein